VVVAGAVAVTSNNNTLVSMAPPFRHPPLVRYRCFSTMRRPLRRLMSEMRWRPKMAPTAKKEPRVTKHLVKPVMTNAKAAIIGVVMVAMVVVAIGIASRAMSKHRPHAQLRLWFISMTPSPKRCLVQPLMCRSLKWRLPHPSQEWLLRVRFVASVVVVVVAVVARRVR
jgi:hypothetical protein